MTRTVILGADAALDAAWQVACEHPGDAVRLALLTLDNFNFDLGPLLKDYPPALTRVFVALDARALNHARHQLIAQVQWAGYSLISLVSSTALVEPGVQIARNVYIGPGTSIGPGCSLGFGCWLDRRVMLERDVSLGACVSLGSAVILAPHVRVGLGSTLSAGSLALTGSEVGKHCEWLLGATLPRHLPDYSLYDELMPEGARIYRY